MAKGTKKKSKKDEGETGGIANAGFAAVRSVVAKMKVKPKGTPPAEGKAATVSTAVSKPEAAAPTFTQFEHQASTGTHVLEVPEELVGAAKLESFLERNPTVPFLSPAHLEGAATAYAKRFGERMCLTTCFRARSRHEHPRRASQVHLKMCRLPPWMPRSVRPMWPALSLCAMNCRWTEP